jgi:hypothetical protein
MGSMYFGRPTLEPLGLDLVDCEGAGSYPTQFYARTADLRPVFIRYGGGRLRVWVGEPGTSSGNMVDDSWWPARAPARDAKIAGDRDGDIGLEQVCEIAGITIRGEVPPAAPWPRIRDFSGRTTYWERGVWLTLTGADDFVAALARVWPDVTVIQYALKKPGYLRRKRISECNFHPILGIGGLGAKLDAMLGGEPARNGDLSAVFKHVIRVASRIFLSPAIDHRSSTEALAARGHNVSFAPGTWATLWGETATSDKVGLGFLHQADAATNAFFRERVAESIDLASGAVISPRSPYWVSPDVDAWCRAEPHRYLLGAVQWDVPKREQPTCQVWRFKSESAED